MSAQDTVPHRSLLPVRRDGFVRLLHAEWTKFRTVPGWVLGTLVAVLVTVLVGALGSAGGGLSCAGPGGGTCADRVPPAGPDGAPVSDGLSLEHRTLTGDGVLTVRLASLTGRYAPGGGPLEQGTGAGSSGVQPWAKAGIIFKDGTRQGSRYAAVMVTGGHGVRMQYDFTHDAALTATEEAGNGPAEAPQWLRLSRSGTTLTGYASADGTHWRTIAAVRLPALPRTVQAGLFTTSPDRTMTSTSIHGASSTSGPTTATARFDHVVLHGTQVRDAWHGTVIGGSSGAGDLGAGHRRGDSGFTVTGSGDVAPAVLGQGAAGRTPEDALVGAFAGLLVVIVIAALYVTGEYRTGLIRTTLTAGPRRGRVLAAKATVIGSVAFVTGLAAAAVTVPLVGALEQHKGFYLYPVAGAVQLRVIAGTAALFAVTAVLTLAVGTLLRRGAATVTTATLAVVVPYVLAVASVLPLGPARWLLRATPAAAFAMQQSLRQYAQVTAGYTPADGYFPLAPWAGLAVLCGYALLAVGLAARALFRRDA